MRGGLKLLLCAAIVKVAALVELSSMTLLLRVPMKCIVGIISVCDASII